MFTIRLDEMKKIVDFLSARYNTSKLGTRKDKLKQITRG
jgi:hypothetical protein